MTDHPALSRRKKTLFILGIWLALAVTGYGTSVVVRSTALYRTIKNVRGGWSDSLYTYDPALGYAPRPNATGQILFFEPPFAPVRHDAEGFRIPVAGRPGGAPSRPLVLALGCSYTYGYGCAADDIFPELVAKGLDGDVVNAGGCGYGLAQMLILARRLIPELRPDYVLVQYSPWLVLRARYPFAQSDVGTVPGPFFATTADGDVELRPPAFPEIVTELPTFDYRFTPSGLGDMAAFLVTVGFPLTLYEDAQMAWAYATGRFAGADMADKVRHIDAPYTFERRDVGERVVERVYEEIEALCRDSGARMAVVVLTKYQPPERHLQILRALPDTLVVETTTPMYGRLPEPVVAEYNRAYCHSRGNPATFADPHPNERAHRVIADLTLGAIRERWGGRADTAEPQGPVREQ